MIPSNSIILKSGTINEYYGSEIKGLINFSQLKEYNAVMNSDFYSLKFVTQGVEHYNIDNAHYNLSAGTFLLVKPNQEVKVYINNNNNITKGICFYFPKSFFDNQLSTHSFNNCCIPNFPIYYKHIQLNSFLSNILHKEININSDLFLNSLINQLSLFISSLNNNLNKSGVNKKDTKLQLWKKIEKGRIFINTHYDTKIKLEHIAEVANLSAFHFHRTFKKLYAQTPNEYLYNIRLCKVKELLKLNTLSIEKIASKCGFEDINYFNKWLRKNNLS